MANTKLAQAAPGTVVKTNYNGAPTNFVVLHQGKPSPIYDDSFNGGTIMRFESIPENYQWTTTGTNDYAASGVQAHIQEYVQYFDPAIQSNIKTVKIPYRPGAGSSATVNSGADGLECQMYLLSVTELGITQGDVPADGAKLDYYLAGTGADAQKKRIANLNGAPARYNTRSPYVNAPATTAAIWEVQAGGNIATIHTGSAFGALTAFVLDANALEIDETGALVKASSGGANTPLKDITPGSVVKAYEDGIVTEFYIDTQNYESALNGNDFVLLTRKDCYDKRAWDAGNVNTYADSDLDAFLNGDYKMLLEENVRNAIVTTKFYYTPGNMNNTVTTLERDVFELSATELGMSQAYVNVEGSVLPIAETLKIAYLNKTASTQWTRSPSTNLTSHAWYLKADGGLDNAGGTANLCGSRPSFCLLGANMYVDSNGFLTADPGAGQMFIPADKLEQGVEYYFRVFPRNHQNQFQTGIDGSVVTAIPGAAKVMTAVIDLNDSNPATCVSYADDAANMQAGSADWDEFFGHYPCLFKDGAEVGKLNPNDFAKFADGSPADITSGAAGDVMIAFPRRGVKITTSGTKVTVSMTNGASEDGFSYLAHQRGETNKDVFYLGVYKGFVDSGKLRSLSGKTPTVKQYIQTFRTQAQANGAGYEQSAFYQLVFRQCMYILKYKNLNSQQAVGMGYVTQNSGMALTGNTNTKGMDWGETTGKQQMKLFGIEDFWGNPYEWVEGVITDPARNIFSATDNFNAEGSGYTNCGLAANANISGFMASPQGNVLAGFIAKTAGGSQSTYFCDQTIVGTTCVAQYGGNWSSGNDVGVFNLLLANGASYAQPSIGSRLMYL